jgi:hypothetical protein
MGWDDEMILNLAGEIDHFVETVNKNNQKYREYGDFENI